MLIKQNAGVPRLCFVGNTGLTPNVTISKNGAAFAAIAGSVAELSDGWYTVNFANSDVNTLGDLAIHFDVGTITDFQDQVVPLLLGDEMPADVQHWLGAVPSALSSGLVQTLTVTFTGGAISSAAFDDNAIARLFSSVPLTESYAADGATATPAQLLYMLWSALSEFLISGATLTCKKLDGSTTSMTFTLSPAGNPTSRARAT